MPSLPPSTKYILQTKPPWLASHSLLGKGSEKLSSQRIIGKVLQARFVHKNMSTQRLLKF
jgi:hypothetical protein